MAQRFRERANEFKAQYQQETAPAATQAQPTIQPTIQPPQVQAPAPQQAQPQIQSNTQQDNFVDPMTLSLPDEYVKAQKEQEEESNKYKDENAKLLKEIEALKKAHDEDLKAVDELAQYKKEHAADEYIKSLGDLGTISADDARRLVTPLIERSNNDIANLTKQISDVRDSVSREFSERDSQAYARKQAAAWKKVGDAFPDLKAIQETAAYREVMSQPIGAGVGITVGTLVATELKKGNADYALDVLKNIRARAAGNSANVADIASINISTPAGGYAGQSDTDMSLEDLAQLNYLYKTKQIGRKTFIERRQKYRAGAGASSSI